MSSITVGTWLLKCLEANGISQAFGIPGVHNIELYRGLPQTGIRHIGGRHEQGLGFMADGYARAGDAMAACFTITGPGLTNISTAMAQAYADSVPMLVVASQNRRGEAGSGRGFLHEMPDQRAFAAQVSGLAQAVAGVDELPEVMARSFARLRSQRPRPAYVEIARDLLAADASRLPAPAAFAPLSCGCAPREPVQAAAQRLRIASRPLILAGGGAAPPAPEVRQLAERLGSPVVMTINGRGILPPAHALNVSYSASLRAVRELIAAADQVLAIGTELGQTDYDMYATGEFTAPAQLLRIDIDPEQMVRNAAPSLALLGDARLTVQALIEALGPAQGAARADAWNAALATARSAAAGALSAAMHSQLAFLDTLRDALPGALFVGDSTQPVYAGNLAYSAASPRSWFNSSSGFGTLGYALPAANGASLAQPRRPVVALAGDGGLQFTLQELGTLRDLGGWVALIVWNNRGFGEIKTSMIDAGVAPTAVDLAPPALDRLAQAYDLPYLKVSRVAGLGEAIGEFARRRAPMLIEIDAGTYG